MDDHQVTAFGPPNMESQIGQKHAICVPMRYVRTNRGEAGALVTKARLTTAGHTDPTVGVYQTDAPTTSHLAVLITAVIAVNMDWSGYVLDVGATFLTGEKLQRELYTRAPREGATSCGGTPPGEGLWALEDSQGSRWFDWRASFVVLEYGRITREHSCSKASYRSCGLDLPGKVQGGHGWADSHIEHVFR